jgi:hypothetical protein
MKSLPRRKLIILALAAVASILVYWMTSLLTYRPGFPLDDAWIHHTYARNLAQDLEWAFLPGQASGGATSPLWVMVLAPGYVVGIPPLLWNGVLGFLMLFGLAAGAEYAYSHLGRRNPGTEDNNPEKFAVEDSTHWSRVIPWMGLVICFEWHLVWAALSGMETLLFSCLVCFVLLLLWRGKIGWFQIGLVCGITVWVRPDGITLLGPIFLLACIKASNWSRRFRSLGSGAAGFLVMFIPYLVFNQVINGSFWPNTLFAKQAEYAILTRLPFWERYLGEVSLPLVGIGSLLLPGVIWLAVGAVRRKDTGVLVGMIWWLGYMGVFALRLPVTYQHGRYVIPSMAIFMVWGVLGMTQALQGLRPGKPAFLISKTWTASAGIILGAFWVLGARAYAADVAVIESEMVNTARWLAGNTAPGATVAAHDIGALGFFGDRQILDLAGLITPDVIPFIRDEGRIEDYLDTKQADYLVIFPDWYPNLVQGRFPIYTSEAPYAPQQGGENMAIYSWEPP